MPDAPPTDEKRQEQADRLISLPEALHVQAQAARERADEAIKHAETLLEDAAERAAQWLVGR